ncbi:MAG: hypothetical protein LBR67_08195 [Dysgonamonadaceae bacterium]|jgi:hypothetical protein|nr:hypothetical protein [Dysgonamonadaceae bacterium]
MNKINYFALILTVIIGWSCGNEKKKQNTEEYMKGTFGYDLNYLSQKDDSLILLSDEGGKSQIIVSSKYQAKVFTSTADGPEGASLGFINYKFFDAGQVDEHMNGYGGENRFWLGPEGGKYSVYFAPGATQVYDNWHTPAPIDTEPWNVASVSEKAVALTKDMEVTNYQGTALKLHVDRSISILSRAEIAAGLGIDPGDAVKSVGYATVNTIVNRNDFEWTTQTGTICIWMLDMFNPAPQALTIVPYNEGPETELGKVVTSDYFGDIPADRLKIVGNTIYLKTDGNFRSKLGLNAKRTKAIAGNYDPDIKRFTVTTYDVDSDAIYLSQEWNPEKDPLTGDAMNAYNDGPLEDGSIMGPFLELESVSPAAFLKPEQSLTHKHSVYHFIGEKVDLNPIAIALFGISLDELWD